MIELNYYLEAIEAIIKHNVIRNYVCGADVILLLNKAENRLTQLAEYLTESEYTELNTRIMGYRREYSVV